MKKRGRKSGLMSCCAISDSMEQLQQLTDMFNWNNLQILRTLSSLVRLRDYCLFESEFLRLPKSLLASLNRSDLTR